MVVDGMTKGVLDRGLLQAAMRGKWLLEHEVVGYPDVPF